MISKGNYELVKQAIRVYNRLIGRTYMLLYKVNAKHISKTMETSIKEENFWHLVGCKIDESQKLTAKDKHCLYMECLAGKDISAFLVYTRQAQDVSKKAAVVIGLFDFVTNAKSIRLCHTEGTPEAAMFKVGAGSINGVVGYSQEEKGMIPKTAQQKSIFKIKANANEKIFLIISKPYGTAKYDRIDFEISEKIFPQIIEELPSKIQYTETLFANKNQKTYNPEKVAAAEGRQRKHDAPGDFI